MLVDRFAGVLSPSSRFVLRVLQVPENFFGEPIKPGDPLSPGSRVAFGFNADKLSPTSKQLYVVDPAASARSVLES